MLHHLGGRDLVGELRLERRGEHVARPTARAGRAGSAAGWRRAGRPTPTASTIVCCGASLSITAMSPNWRSASTSTTGSLGAPGEHDGEVGGDDRLAGAALGREDRDDLAELARRRRRRHRLGRARRRGRSPTRRTDSTSAGGVDRGGEHVLDAGPQRLPEEVGGELGGDEDRARPRGGSATRRSASARPSGRAHDGPSTTTTGVAGEPLPERVERGDGDGELAELHGQPAADRLVGVDDDDRHRRPAGVGARAAAQARRTAGVAEVVVEAGVAHVVVLVAGGLSGRRAGQGVSSASKPVGAVRASAGRASSPGSSRRAGRCAGRAPGV